MNLISDVVDEIILVLVFFIFNTYYVEKVVQEVYYIVHILMYNELNK